MAEFKYKMTEGNPLTIVHIFAISMIMSNLFHQLHNMIDTIIVDNWLGVEIIA